MKTVFHIYKKLILFIEMVVAILVHNHIFGWLVILSGTGSLNLLRRMAEENPVNAIFLYTAITVVGCVALTLPGVTFAILAGLFFGSVLGTIYCSLTTMIGAMTAFLVGRFFLKDSIKPVVMKNRYPKRWLFDEVGKNELFVLMITRLISLFPYNSQNPAYGVTDTPFSTRSIFSLTFTLPGTAMYTIGTSGLVDKENRVLYISIAVILAIIVMGMGMFFKKKYVVQSERMEEINGQESQNKGWG